MAYIDKQDRCIKCEWKACSFAIILTLGQDLSSDNSLLTYHMGTFWSENVSVLYSHGINY